jgi:hypothetical protein
MGKPKRLSVRTGAQAVKPMSDALLLNHIDEAEERAECLFADLDDARQEIDKLRLALRAGRSLVEHMVVTSKQTPATTNDAKAFIDRARKLLASEDNRPLTDEERAALHAKVANMVKKAATS